MSDHTDHLNTMQTEQVRNLIDLIGERLQLTAPHDRTAALVDTCRKAVAELQRELAS